MVIHNEEAEFGAGHVALAGILLTHGDEGICRQCGCRPLATSRFQSAADELCAVAHHASRCHARGQVSGRPSPSSSPQAQTCLAPLETEADLVRRSV